jgi:tartrate-resistant acid phosphatase type 5
VISRLAPLLLLIPSFLQAQATHTYVGGLEPHQVLIAWGTTGGQNTIGKSSASMGKAILTVGDQKIPATENWAIAKGLDPDHEYHYEVAVDSKKIGEGKFRTWPEHATSLCFFVLGDYGTGTDAQSQVAAAMDREYQKHAASGCPIRFVITTGDNIYADLNVGFHAVHSGDSDTDWEDKFFKPYENLIREIPFFPSPGNHDSTANSETGRSKPVYLESGEQFSWLTKALGQATVPWRIPYYHHPIFNAGPFHGSSFKELKHFLPLFQQDGVKVVFNGHEHNFQYSERSDNTSGIRFVISGAGGELRHGDVRGKMIKNRIEGWSPELHFLSVDIEGKEMRITPLGVKAPLVPTTNQGTEGKMPLLVTVP